MLEKLRKFSSSIFAKIFLFIVAIPFVFWGMGGLFRGGAQNTIVQIDRDKISTSEFLNYVNIYGQEEEKLDENFFDDLLSIFIGEKLIEFEIEKYGIKLSDKALSEIIKNQEIFKKKNKFSRIEYEKFLVMQGISAINFETGISKQEKKKQLLNFVGGGIVPSDFLTNINFNKVNQKRNVKLINLNEVLKRKFKFSENQIESYFKQNKKNYSHVYKTIKYLKLNPKNLTGNNEFSDLFFKKLDEIDDLIAEGQELDFISDKFNFDNLSSLSFNKFGEIINSEKKIEFSQATIEKIFNTDKTESTILFQDKEEYFILEVTKTENIQKKISDMLVRESILINLQNQAKRKFISELIHKINSNTFSKIDFDKFSKNENVPISKVRLENQNDLKILKQNLINQIYAFPEKKVIVIADIGLSESYLVYIESIESTSAKKNSEDFKKYYNLSKIKMTNNLYNTYNSYLKNKYKIKINYSALNSVKDYYK